MKEFVLNLITLLLFWFIVYTKIYDVQYKRSGNGKTSHVKNEAFKMLILGPVISACYVSIGSFGLFSRSSKSIFYTITILVICLAAFIFIYAPLLMIKRQNRTINHLEIEDNEVSVSTFSVLFLRSKNYKIPFSNIDLRNANFNWYGPSEKRGVIFRVKSSNQELYLVSDYFDNFDSILNSVPLRNC